jgi:quercetin dioxygenase-like cupin family protein
VEEGTLFAEIGGSVQQLSAGDGALVLSNQPHSYTTPEHSKSWTLIFSPDLIPELKQIIAKKGRNKYNISRYTTKHN